MHVLWHSLLVALLCGSALSLTIKYDKPIKLGQVPTDFQGRIFETEINETLECLRYTLETGLPEAGIPSISSIEIPAFNISLDNLPDLPATSGYLNILGGVLNGVTGFHAPDLSFSVSLIPVGFGVGITMVIPNFYLELDYDMDMIATGIPIYGTGKFIIDWTNLTFEISGFLGITGQVELRNLSIYITIGESVITISGWYHDDEHSQVVTDLVNDYLIPQWINGQTEEISEVISPILEFVINLLLTIGGEGNGGEGDSNIGDILAAIAANCNLDARTIFKNIK